MTITDAVLAKAVREGVITVRQAARLGELQFAAQGSGPVSNEPVNEEKLRFISGFGDVFVTIGLILFLGSTAYFLDRASWSWLAPAGSAVLAWALAEFFTRRRRMTLPSIVLLVVFTIGSFLALSATFGGSGARAFFLDWISPGLFSRGRDPVGAALAAFGTAALVAFHYRRFRVPITVAAGTAALASAAIASFYALAPELTSRSVDLLLLLAGLAVFALGMRFDLTDPLRMTRAADIAFWLHLLAAPLIVHSVFSAVLRGRAIVTIEDAALVIGIFLLLGLVAILVDRRALLVSGLAYAGYAFGSLIRRAIVLDLTVPATLLTLGALVLLVSAGWRPLRGALLGLLPPHLANRLPHPALS